MSIYLQNHGIAKPIGGGINQTLLDRLNAAENEIQLIKEELAKSGADLEAIKTSRATESAYGLAKISGATTVTEDLGLVLSAKEKNPSVPGTIANDILTEKNRVSDLYISKIAHENIRDISEIFDYRKTELALFSNWNDNPICPRNYSMILRIPNLDFSNAKCIFIGDDLQLLIGRVLFSERRIDWSEK